MKKTTVTKEQYDVLDAAYCFFNKILFGNTLPDVMIVLHRKKSSRGYFHAERFAEREKPKGKKAVRQSYDELSLNPDEFERTDIAILSTLVHEMVHVWQYRCTEKFPRNGYHDKKWGAKMKEVGLYPSNTGSEGGKETGQKMTHYIIKGGAFERHALKFIKTNKIRLSSFPMLSAESKGGKNKTKYQCGCGTNIWAKSGLHVTCDECEMPFEELS